MKYSLANYILEIIGAFVVWAVKGFKGKLSDEVSSPYETNSKSIRNAIISILLIVSLVFMISKREDTKTEEPPTFKYEIAK